MAETSRTFREFLRAARQWAIGAEHKALALGMGHAQLRNAEKAAAAGAEVVLPSAANLRLACLIDIAEALRSRRSTRAEQTVWLKAPNVDFGGQTPLERIIEQDVAGLFYVRRYLQGTEDLRR